MEELAVNLTQEEALAISMNFPLEPARNRVIITVNTEENDDIDLIGAGLSETQFVLSTGPHVWDKIKPGTKVCLDLEKMSSTNPGTGSFEIHIDPVKVGDRVFAYVYDSSIKAIDNR
tara:strand:+ start:20019 stop:20369 length:351 start_codon:yes stop_codon:yes gene_type:complete